MESRDTSTISFAPKDLSNAVGEEEGCCCVALILLLKFVPSFSEEEEEEEEESISLSSSRESNIALFIVKTRRARLATFPLSFFTAISVFIIVDPAVPRSFRRRLRRDGADEAARGRMTIFFRNDNDAELLRARPRHLKPPLLFLLLAMSDDDWLFTSDAAVVAAKVPARDDNILCYKSARVCVVSVLLQGRRNIFVWVQECCAYY
jgi:hypothetical protein